MSDQATDPIPYRGNDINRGRASSGASSTDAAVADWLSGFTQGAASDTTWILRSRTPASSRNVMVPGPARGALESETGRRLPSSAFTYRKDTPAKDNTSTIDDFNAEFFEKWNTPEFQTWLTSRMVAMGERDTSTRSAYAFWVTMGEQTAKARGTQWSPEQYIEFMANGGLYKGLDEIESEMAAGAPVLDENGEPLINPIQTQTSVRYNDMNPLAANTAIDEMSMALLGRMATKAEMKRLRGVINGILKKNPDVATTTTDSSDPDNVTSTTTTDAGMSAGEAVEAVQMKMLRSSEGQAFNAGKLLEEAMRSL